MNSYTWNEKFQSKLLALIVRKPERVWRIVEPQYFTVLPMIDICRIAKDIYKQHGHETKLTKTTLYTLVKDWLGKRRREIWPLYKKTIRAAFKESLADEEVIVAHSLGFAKDRKFREALVQMEKDVNSGRFEAAYRRLESLKGMEAIRSESGTVVYWQGIGDKDRWHDERHGAIKTWFLRTLDRRMGGGLGGGELAIVFAGGKVGKSAFLGRVALGALWQGKKVAIATGELSAKKYRKRIDAMITGIKYEDLYKLRKDVRRRLKRAVKQIKGCLYIKQFPTGKASIRDVEVWLDALEEETGEKIDMLVLDYIRVFKPTQRYDEQRLNIGEVTLELRGLAMERDIPVWTASQARRDALGKARLTPKDLAEDISQFWTTDFLVALCQTLWEEEHDQIRILVVSARDVASGGTVWARTKKGTYAFTEVDKWREHKEKGHGA